MVCLVPGVNDSNIRKYLLFLSGVYNTELTECLSTRFQILSSDIRSTTDFLFYLVNVSIELEFYETAQGCHNIRRN